MKIYLPILIFAIAATFVVYFATNKQVQTTSDVVSQETGMPLQAIQVRAPQGIVNAMIADTDRTREHGLSDRESLATDAGLLFIFPNVSTSGFWMKDMHFALDIVWINEQKQVIGIDANISPDTYPDVFMPPAPIKYVLELNAGKAADFDIEKGVQLVF
jgi:uncharacterized protein